MKCERCQTEQVAKSTKTGLERLPMGWKRTATGCQCKACWRAQFVARCVTIPIRECTDEDMQWKDFMAALSAQWAEATRLANWIHTQRYIRDVRREPGIEKMPAMPQAYLYPEARRAFPLLQPAATCAIDQAETKKYRETRYEVIWTSGRSLSNVRYPYPLPIGDDSISLEEVDGRMYATIRLGTAEHGRRWRLALAGGSDWKRQLDIIRRMMNGEIKLTEAAIYRVEAKASDGRSGGKAEDSRSGGMSRIMLKIAGWYPIRERDKEDRLFSIKTDSESLFYGVIENAAEPWVVNAAHVRDWVYQHYRDLRTINQDQKAHWKPRRRRRQSKVTMSQKCEKHNDRIDSWVKTTVAAIMVKARQMRVTWIKYDDSYREYFGSNKFCWDKIRQQLRNKCEENGIGFEIVVADASGRVAQQKPRAARKTSKALAHG